MATATRTKPNVRAEFDEREAKYAKARAKASELGSDFGIKLRRARELHDERRRLAHKDPSLVDHTGAPVSEDNPVAAVDREIQELGDLEDLNQRAEHARKLEQSAKQSLDDYTATHFWELMEAFEAEARAVADSTNEAAKGLAQELHRYLRFHQRIAGLTAPVQGITAHVVPGLDAVSNYLRVVESIDLPPPVPESPEDV
jgi:hypothetical protein